MAENDLVSVRYMVTDVDESVAFYTRHFGFTLGLSAAPAFAEVIRGRLRLLLAGPEELGRPTHARWSRAGTRWLEPDPLRGR